MIARIIKAVAARIARIIKAVAARIARIKQWFSDRKTHIAAICSVIAVLWMYKTKQADAKDVVEAVGAAMSLMFLRHALQKNTNSTLTSADIVRQLREQIVGDVQSGTPPPPSPPSTAEVPLAPVVVPTGPAYTMSVAPNSPEIRPGDAVYMQGKQATKLPAPPAATIPVMPPATSPGAK